MVKTEKFVQFAIPTLSVDNLGVFHSAEIRNGEVIVKFYPAGDARSTFKIESGEKILEFSS
jgi:hypothetical protein